MMLLDGKLGIHPHRKVHIELLADAIYKHAKTYSAPHVHLEVLNKELFRLCKINVLEPMGKSKWAQPSFIIPKKDRSVFNVSNLLELNKVIKRKVYPLPTITDILGRCAG